MVGPRRSQDKGRRPSLKAPPRGRRWGGFVSLRSNAEQGDHTKNRRPRIGPSTILSEEGALGRGLGRPTFVWNGARSGLRHPRMCVHPRSTYQNRHFPVRSPNQTRKDTRRKVPRGARKDARGGRKEPREGRKDPRDARKDVLGAVTVPREERKAVRGGSKEVRGRRKVPPGRSKAPREVPRPAPRPNGAKACSHGWSEAAPPRSGPRPCLAQPVEAFVHAPAPAGRRSVAGDGPAPLKPSPHNVRHPRPPPLGRVSVARGRLVPLEPGPLHIHLPFSPLPRKGAVIGYDRPHVPKPRLRGIIKHDRPNNFVSDG